MAHFSDCGIVLIHMQIDIAGCARKSNGGKKNNNQLTAKSCRGRSGNDSGRGDGSCGTCASGDSVDVTRGDNNGIDNCNGKGNGDSGRQRQQQQQWQWRR